MLAWLLNPAAGRHGLGGALLDRVVADHLKGLEPESSGVRTVQVEVQRADTRADTVVWGDVAYRVWQSTGPAEELPEGNTRATPRTPK